ncbi:MAG: DUF615 domain-containing protein [Burkholderiales bacterium]|nr:DUF615 domain-containing protein [Burkholderiales bacterium]
MQEEQDETQSKSSRKKEMHALQDIGELLVELNSQRLGELDLPEKLLDAVKEAKRLTQFGAIRRQMQYIGKLMREIDAEGIREKLALWDAQSKENATEFHLVERWRERLLAEENAFGEFARTYPQADLTHLRNLVRSIQKDRLADKPPKQYRAFFRQLRDIVRTG